MYRLRPSPFADLRAWLQEREAFWGVQLAAFKTQAERKTKGIKRHAEARHPAGKDTS